MSSASERPPPQVRTTKAQVWIVEDTRLDAFRAQSALSEIAECRVFEHGSAMLECLGRENPPDAMLLDWQLPELSGPELCRFLRSTYDEAALPILIVTVMSASSDVAEALEAGANDLVRKPFEDVELRARMTAALRTKQLLERARYAERALERERARLHDSEAKFRRLAESGIIGILSMDLAGNVLDANDALLEMIGQTRAELAAGRVRMRELTPPEYLDADDNAFRELLERGVCNRYEKVLIRPDGRQLTVLQGAALLGNERRYAIAYLLDVTEHRSVEADRSRLYEAERRARAEAEMASLMKDEFLATVSHELRTPLNAILGWSQLARVHKNDAQLTKAIETIERNARAQSKLINDILDISRIVSGKVRLERASVDLGEIVANTVESVRPAASAKNIALKNATPRGVTLFGDPDRLQQVVWNLLTNAVKFTPNGGQVEVSVKLQDDRLTLCVSDNGRGIRADFLPHVFDRFRQADASTTRTQGGLGLGLSIVQHLAQLHGGRVWADSPGLNQGSRFFVELPIVEAYAASPEPPSVVAPTSAQPPAPAALVGMRVLVVDDEADSRTFLASLLAQYGAEVVSADSANEGFREFEAHRPHVVVSDIAMPLQDGYEFVRRIRALPKEAGGEVPAVALTAYARTEDERRALSEGFQMHLPKPVDIARIVQVVSSFREPDPTP